MYYHLKWLGSQVGLHLPKSTAATFLIRLQPLKRHMLGHELLRTVLMIGQAFQMVVFSLIGKGRVQMKPFLQPLATKACVIRNYLLLFAAFRVRSHGGRLQPQIQLQGPQLLISG